MRRLRRAWGTSIAAWLAVFAIGATFAMAGESSPEVPDLPAVEVDDQDVEDDVVVAAEESESEVSDSTEGKDNHGQCVSYWAHEAKAQGLEGSRKGHFVSSVAQDPDASGEGGGESCDFQADLDAALAEQEAEALAEAAEEEDGSKGHGKGSDDDGEDADDDGDVVEEDGDSEDGDTGEVVTEGSEDDSKGKGGGKARAWKDR